MTQVARPNAQVRKTGNRKASPGLRWSLSTNLKRLRQARGYTQERLGRLCGLNESFISNVEQGTVNIGLADLEALATGLECAAEDLLRTGLVSAKSGPRRGRKFVGRVQNESIYRTARDIEARLDMMWLLTPDQRKTASQFTRSPAPKKRGKAIGGQRGDRK